MEWIIAVVLKFTDAKALALDTCGGTLVTANVCLQLSEYRRFVEGENDFVRFQEARQFLVEVYEKQLLRSGCNKAGSDEAVEAKKVFVRKMSALMLKLRLDSWTLSP